LKPALKSAGFFVPFSNCGTFAQVFLFFGHISSVLLKSEIAEISEWLRRVPNLAQPGAEKVDRV
jgi:hypothetical protein